MTTIDITATTVVITENGSARKAGEDRQATSKRTAEQIWDEAFGDL